MASATSPFWRRKRFWQCALVINIFGAVLRYYKNEVSRSFYLDGSDLSVLDVPLAFVLATRVLADEVAIGSSFADCFVKLSSQFDSSIAVYFLPFLDESFILQDFL